MRREVGQIVGGPQLDAAARDRFGVELEDAAALAERGGVRRVVGAGAPVDGAHGKMVVTSSATARWTSRSSVMARLIATSQARWMSMPCATSCAA